MRKMDLLHRRLATAICHYDFQIGFGKNLLKILNKGSSLDLMPKIKPEFLRDDIKTRNITDPVRQKSVHSRGTYEYVFEDIFVIHPY